MALVAAFTKATGVEVKVVNESLDDVQPKASVAANTGQGPDMFWGLYSLPHLFPAKCIDVTDVADYLGKKYGGWVADGRDLRQERGKSGSRSRSAYNGNVINYRQSMIEKAGLQGDPEGHRRLPRADEGAEGEEHAGRLRARPRAAATATPGCTGWLWSYGGNLVDKNDKVIINSPETRSRRWSTPRSCPTTFVPGTASWNDSVQQQGVPRKARSR